MTRLTLIVAALAAAGLGACSPTSRSDASSLGSVSGRSSDTLGTQRRVDVYGGSTSPVLPTMGAPGFGK